MSAAGRGTERNPSDFYPTPVGCFLPLVKYIPRVEVWEPAQGDGRLVLWMRRTGKIKSSGDDLNNGYDFLLDQTRRDCIVTNPPFSLAQEFCEHAIEVSPVVFMLLRLNFLGGLCRRDWWRLHEPKAPFVCSQRPSFNGSGNTDATEYAWFYWGPQHRGVFHL